MKTAIDLFAGGGGFTEGARLAGVDVIWAANHCPTAVEYHATNHPTAAHVCQDLNQADFTKVPSADMVLASPCCQGHSKSRGKNRPHHDASRSTAWAVVSCVEYHRPRAVIVENVEEFRNWQLFKVWRSALEALGYRMTETMIDAADVGVPQNRRRLFLVGCRDVRNFAMPNPAATHVNASSFIDFDAGRWSQIEKPGRAKATLERVAAGRLRFGSRFLFPYYGNGSGKTGRSLERPIGTITTVDGWAVADGDRMRMLTLAEYRRAMAFRSDYSLPSTRREAIRLLGNAVPPPLAGFVVSAVAAAI